MKLPAKVIPLQAVMMHFNLPGELHAQLEQYCAYYKTTYSQDVEIRELLVMMTEHFIREDQDFNQWSHSHKELASDNGRRKKPLANGSLLEEA